MTEIDWQYILVIYGPLGIACVVLGYVCRALYRDRERDRTMYASSIEGMRKAWDEERNTLQERHITKAETWMEKHAELAKALKDVLESALKKRGP